MKRGAEDSEEGWGQGDSALPQEVARADLSGVETFNPKQVTETTSEGRRARGVEDAEM